MNSTVGQLDGLQRILQDGTVKLGRRSIKPESNITKKHCQKIAGKFGGGNKSSNGLIQSKFEYDIQKHCGGGLSVNR